MKVIQLRGVNGVGKTTAVRQYIERGEFCVESIEMNGKQYFYHFDGKIAIIGRYDLRQSGGIDGCITDKHELKNLITRMLRVIKPETLIFEGVMYGKTFQFSYDISLLAKALGYEYLAVCLVPSFDVSILRIWGRNGNKDVNVENLESMYRQAIKTNSMLRSSGVNTVEIDTGSVPKDEMYTILEGII